MAAVAGVDYGNGGFLSGDKGRTLFGMADGRDISKTGNGADGIGHAFALGGGTGIGGRKADDAAAEVQHGSLKAQPGAGAGLVEECGDLFSVTDMGVFLPVVHDIGGKLEQAVDLLHRKIQRVEQMSHLVVSL